MTRISRHRSSRAVVAAVAVVALLGTLTAQAASRIYRTVDENGNVVFTDVPPKPEQPGEAVELETGNTFTPPELGESGDAGTPSRSLEEWLEGGDGGADDEAGASAQTGYRSLAVASPANDEGLRDNAGNVTVTAAIEPQLATGHVMQLYLDGQLRRQGQTTSFPLQNVDRGTHSVQLRVVDASGNTLITSEPSVFHLQRRSVIMQPNRGN